MENESIGCGTSMRESWLQTVAEVFKGFLQKRKAELFRRMEMTGVHQALQ